MSKTTESLWPSLTEITLPTEIAPVLLLQAQADAISKQTHNIIEGQVILEKVYGSAPNIWWPGNEKKANSPVAENDQYIRHSLFVRAPLLSGYRYRILFITHKVSDLYPVRIQSQISDKYVKDEDVQNQEELLQAIYDTLHSTEVQGVLSSLLAQSGYKQEA